MMKAADRYAGGFTLCPLSASRVHRRYISTARNSDGRNPVRIRNATAPTADKTDANAKPVSGLRRDLMARAMSPT